MTLDTDDKSFTALTLTKGKRSLAPDVYSFNDREILKGSTRKNRTRRTAGAGHHAAGPGDIGYSPRANASSHHRAGQRQDAEVGGDVAGMKDCHGSDKIMVGVEVSADSGPSSKATIRRNDDEILSHASSSLLYRTTAIAQHLRPPYSNVAHRGERQRQSHHHHLYNASGHNGTSTTGRSQALLRHHKSFDGQLASGGRHLHHGHAVHRPSNIRNLAATSARQHGSSGSTGALSGRRHRAMASNFSARRTNKNSSSNDTGGIGQTISHHNRYQHQQQHGEYTTNLASSTAVQQQQQQQQHRRRHQHHHHGAADATGSGADHHQVFPSLPSSSCSSSSSSFNGISLREHIAEQHRKQQHEHEHQQHQIRYEQQLRQHHRLQRRKQKQIEAAQRQEERQRQHDELVQRQRKLMQEQHDIEQQQRQRQLNTSEKIAAAPPARVCRQPITPAMTIKSHANCLTDFEQSEVLEYRQVYYFGENVRAPPSKSTQSSKQPRAEVCASSPLSASESASASGNANVKQFKVQGTASNLLNHGYDDERGDYNLIVGDHIGFRYEILKVIGKGSFGQVVKCIDHKTGRRVAIKLIRNKKRFHHQAVIEVKILEHINTKDATDDKCIVRMVDYMHFRNHLCIVFELLGDNLYDFIKANNFKGMSTNLIRKIASQLLVSLVFLSKQNIIHCDLKPENILLCNNKDREPNSANESTAASPSSSSPSTSSHHRPKSLIKMIDFGSSCFIDERVYTYIQSRFYRAPEIILGQPYSTMIDMWSFGCILAELYTGYPIFPGSNETEQLACIMEVLGLPPKDVLDSSSRKKMFFDTHGQARHIVNARGKKRRPGTKDVAMCLRCPDASFVSLIEGCLRWDAKERLTPEQAVQHSFFNKTTTAYAASLTSSDPHHRHHHHHHRTHHRTHQQNQQQNQQHHSHRIPSTRGNAQRGVGQHSSTHGVSQAAGATAGHGFVQPTTTTESQTGVGMKNTAATADNVSRYSLATAHGKQSSTSTVRRQQRVNKNHGVHNVSQDAYAFSNWETNQAANTANVKAGPPGGAWSTSTAHHQQAAEQHLHPFAGGEGAALPPILKS